MAPNQTSSRQQIIESSKISAQPDSGMTFLNKAGKIYRIMIAQMLCGMLLECIEKHAPLHSKCVSSSNSPWM